tara:strand:- start:391 stop:663 length:273 start_codon:yes stop_codon:yes gene_type:complete
MIIKKMSLEQKKFNKSLDNLLSDKKELFKLNEDEIKTLKKICKTLLKSDSRSQWSEKDLTGLHDRYRPTQKEINAYLSKKILKVIKDRNL